MKNKNFAILLAVLGILVIIYIVQQVSSGKKTIAESVIKLFPGFDPADVALISVYKEQYPDSGIAFARKDTGWIVTSYHNAPGKKSDIEKIMTDVKGLGGEIRSTNPSLFGDFGLADNEALHLKFMKQDSTVLLHFLAGKGIAESPRSSFLRRFGSDTVYKADENFISRFAMWNAEPWRKIQVNRWLELKMTELPLDSVISCDLVVKGKTNRFVKETQIVEDTTAPPKSSWKQVESGFGKKIAEGDISGILSRLANMRAFDLTSGEIMESAGLQKPEAKAFLTTTNSGIIEISFGAMADTTQKTRYAMVSGKPFIYKVSDSIYESVFVTPFKKSD